MKPETELYLANARRDVAEAEAIASIGLSRVAARTLYYAIFHAAEACIFEHTGKVAKTHSGVRTEFARLLRDGLDVDVSALRLLSELYKRKELADYAIGDLPAPSAGEIAALIERAAAVVTQIEAALAR